MKCYLCTHDTHRVRKGSARDNSSLKILECTNCGLVALDSAGHIETSHYENSGMHGEAVPSMTQWLRDTAQDDQRRFDMLKPAIVNRKVLDFGCGAGGFVLKAQALAASVAGVELEERVHDHWGDALTLHRSLDAAGGGYDLVTAFHVIEHLADPRVMLKNLAACMASGGRLVVEVPSSEDALLTLYANDAFQKFTYWSQHLYLFNADTLRVLANQAGLKVIAVEQFQRYPLSNHLHWLSRNQPGGHQQWGFLDTPALNAAYAASLAAVGKCDTVIAHLEKA